MARCLENNTVEIVELKCVPPPPITCANGFKPVAVPDDDLCCWHWECDCKYFYIEITLRSYLTYLFDANIQSVLNRFGCAVMLRYANSLNQTQKVLEYLFINSTFLNRNVLCYVLYSIYWDNNDKTYPCGVRERAKQYTSQVKLMVGYHQRGIWTLMFVQDLGWGNSGL